MDILRELFPAGSLEESVVVLLKIGIGALLGGLIGYERELHGRPAGIRTHILMAIGVMLFCEAGRVFDPNEPARIAAQVVTGVGFLGAGTILRLGAEIKGLTSAASIWAVAGIGMGVSAGGHMIWVAIFGTILSLVTLSWLDKLERKLVPYSHPRALQCVVEADSDGFSVVERIESTGALVKGIRVHQRSPELILQIDVQRSRPDLIKSVMESPGVKSADWMD